MAIRSISIGPIPNALVYDTDINPPSGPFALVSQPAPAAASTSHSTADFAGVNTALNALGTAINALRTALINSGVLT